MIMQSCNNCWLDPCECGHMYLHMSAGQIQKQITILEEVLRDKLIENFRKNNLWDGSGSR